MPNNSCPQCRGELIDDVANGVWYVIFSTLTTTAAGLYTNTFKLDVLLANNTQYPYSLPSTTGVPGSNGRTTFSWTITSPGEPVSGTISVDHATQGSLVQGLAVSQQGAAAS